MTNQINARIKEYSNYRNVNVDGYRLETSFIILWTCPDCQEESKAFIEGDLDRFNLNEISEFFVFYTKCRKQWSVDIQVDFNVKIISETT